MQIYIVSKRAKQEQEQEVRKTSQQVQHGTKLKMMYENESLV